MKKIKLDRRLKSSFSVFLDLVIGFSAGFWASGTFSDYNTFIAILSIVSAIAKLILEFGTVTIEEEIYNLYHNQLKFRLSDRNRIESELNEKIIEAIKNGDLDNVKNLNTIKNELKNEGNV